MAGEQLCFSGQKEMKESLITKFLFVCLFLMSLQSYYFYNINMAPLPVLSVICLVAILVIFVRTYSITSTHQVFLLILFYIYLFIHAIYFVFANGEISPLFSVAITFFTFFSFIFILNDRGTHIFIKPIKVVLLIHLMSWYTQFGVWLYSGSYLDFLEPITGEAQRYLSLKGLTFGSARMPRFTGLYNEPGTYSTYIFLLLAVQYRLTGGRFGVIEALAVVSMFLSMSLFGVVLSAVYGMVVVFVNPKLSPRYKILVVFLIILIAILIYPDIDRRLTSSYSGVDDRYDYISYIFERDDLLFGGRYIGDFAINDLGVFIYLFAMYGVVGVLIFGVLVASIISRKIGIGCGILFMAVLATKIKLTYPLFWFFLAIYIHNEQAKKSKKSI